MGKYSGTLHKLIENASATNSKPKWNQVLQYLEGHTIADSDVSNPNFESPLPPYSSPTVELEGELFDQQGAKRDDSPLKIAVRSAPAIVVGAICHLGQEAAKLADSRDRLPIHWACRRSSDDAEAEKVIKILVKAAPETLLHRDDGGRTPLHWLFWYHAPTRSPELVKFLCQKLPIQSFHEIRQPRDSQNERYPLPEIPIPNGRKTDVPAIAAVVPDARHGALPLHYAVMQGASKDVLKVLIKEYPNSLAYGDRKGRTALAWYLGAGHLLDNNKRHICGEANDPNATPWWFVKLSPAIIQLLVSSKVARAVDDMERTTLHWACHFYARSTMALDNSSLPVKALQILLDNNIEAVVSQDSDGKTPLHVLFDVVAEQQELEHQRLVANRTLRDNVDLLIGGPPAFSPSKQMMELLLKSPDVDGQDAYRQADKRPSAATHVEDTSGLLPIHTALRVACDSETIRLLIQSNPTALIHASEDELQTPLVHAFCSEYTAPLQTLKTFELLMAAYVTSRHGTFIDGRVALKMEDACGTYPLHYACEFQASSAIIRTFVEKFPHCAVNQNSDGDLPLHCLLSKEYLFEQPPSGIARGATLSQNSVGLQTEKETSWKNELIAVNREKIKILIEPLQSAQQLQIASSAHGMTPAHIAIAFRAVPYTTLYHMLDAYPDAATMITTTKGYELSCMDLHESNKEEWDSDDWDAIREMLFAFNPLLDEHRRKEDLLEACVQVVRNEICGKGSYHLEKLQGQRVTTVADIELKETLSSIAMPEIDVAYRSKNRKSKKENKEIAKKIAKKSESSLKINTTFSYGEKKEVKKSIYDDDLDERYVVSPENSSDEDDDFLSSEEEEEEYYSDEGSGTGTYEGTSFERSSNPSSWDHGMSTGPSGTFTESVNSPSNASPRSAVSPRSGTSSPGKRSRKNRKERNNFIEEKKEETVESGKRADFILSDVAMRILCFFVLFNNPKDPSDNYIKQVEAITEELEFDVLQRIVNLPVPSYAAVYLEKETSTVGKTLFDLCCPTSNALFRSFQYFLGKYEFPTELDTILLHREIDGSTIYVRAIEHVIRTQEFLPKKEFAPGEAEEAIWETGEKVEEEGGYYTSKFVDKKRTVFFKFTRNQKAYDNEVQCRSHLGLQNGDDSLSNVLPLLQNFGTSTVEKKDRRFAMDVNDERFQNLRIFGGEVLNLSKYPYALVYPYSDEGDLFDYFFHHGIDELDDIADIGKQVAGALKMLHEKGVVHGNISMRHVKLVPLDDENSRRTWAVSDFSTATRSLAEPAFMGTISSNGSVQFQSGLLPPEMFVKLTAAEARIYQTYWEMVEKVYKVEVDRRVVDPFVNLQDGATYVIRCHYLPQPDKKKEGALPELPYMLVPSRESTDLWCFGLILFVLCSGGRPLFPSNLKTGHLLDYESIVDWEHEKASARIYEYVEDPVAQDLLLKLLSPYESRVELTMEDVLNHPFFSLDEDKSALIEKMIDQRQHESAAHDRRRRQVISAKSGDNWLDDRTTNVTCWNFDLLRKFNFSAAEVLGKLLRHKASALTMPTSFIVLPYKLSGKNKKAKLAPTTKKDVERAERMGVLLLSLGKACFFACRLQDILEKGGEQLWTATKLLDELTLPKDEFKAVKDDFLKLAATHIEAFRADPISTAHKLVERRITEIRKFFKDSGKAFLYLVDEFSGIPLVGTSYVPYPLEISEGIIDKFLVRALPFMYISVMHVRGVSGGISGLVRLIFEAAYPHVPPSWATAGAGLPHRLDEHAFLQEVSMLRAALALLYSTKANFLEDDLRFVRESCLKVDARGEFAGMQRVVSADCSLWTTKEGAAEIQDSCRTFGFKEALEIQGSLEGQLRFQEQQIRRLQEEVERLTFRKDLNLDVPESSTSTRGISNVSVPNIVTTPSKSSATKPPLSKATSPTPVKTNISGSAVDPTLALSQTESSLEEFYDTKDAPSFDESKPLPSSIHTGLPYDSEAPLGESPYARATPKVDPFAETPKVGASSVGGKAKPFSKKEIPESETNQQDDAGNDDATYKSDTDSLRDTISLD